MNENEQIKDLRPIPDPTVLTTEQLHREILHLREVLEEKIDSVEVKARLSRESIIYKLDAQRDTAQKQEKHLSDAISETRVVTQEAIKSLSNVYEAQHNGLVNKVDDIKSRIDSEDASKRGEVIADKKYRAGKVEDRANISTTTTVIGSIIAAIILALSIYSVINSNRSSEIVPQTTTVFVPLTTTTP